MEKTINKYDVVVVGSGTAGQTAAYHLKDNGLKVALVEKSDFPGGTCALSGCQPKNGSMKLRKQWPDPGICLKKEL
jgi:pyruvate/2-oxoglutarate dehydrogenase complex dihydrolipoamide dehydrogenase (E3) component